MIVNDCINCHDNETYIDCHESGDLKDWGGVWQLCSPRLQPVQRVWQVWQLWRKRFDIVKASDVCFILNLSLKRLT